MSRGLLNRYKRELVGAGFFGFLTFAGYYTIVFRETESLARPIYVPVRLETAEGLRIGARVEIQGVEQGFLTSLHYLNVDEKGWPLPYETSATPSGQTVIAILQLRAVPITYPDYVAYSRSPSPLAARGIDLVPGKPGHAPALNPQTLTEQEHREFLESARLPHKTGQDLLFIKNFDDPLYLVAKLLAENRHSITRIVTHVTGITDQINEGDGTLGLLLNQDSLHAGSNVALLEFNHLVGDMRDLLESLRENLGPIDSASALLSYILIFL
ncbi:MAG: hypothetical protein HS115_14755 [Spirochaetales bacterium]|nr:hypothetical protein [Spirochaetales bacterium]